MKVYVYCPAGYVSGGPEALHQLANKALATGVDAKMVYFPHESDQSTPTPFKCYNVEVADAATDDEDSVIVVPETKTDMAYKFKHAKVVIWWLSIDNYFVIKRKRNWKKKLASAVKGHKDYDFENNGRIYHAAQSKYAWDILQKKQMNNLYMLTDYLRAEFFEEINQSQSDLRENIVVYNPLKGSEFTQQLIEESKFDVQWVPIENMTPKEVRGLLLRAKIYIDFGPHPGRDRLPREAAVCGCCIVTGLRGSAGNSTDIPIPDAFKFPDDGADVHSQVVDCLQDITTNYEKYISSFATYRSVIEKQEQEFEGEVNTLLGALSS